MISFSFVWDGGIISNPINQSINEVLAKAQPPTLYEVFKAMALFLSPFQRFDGQPKRYQYPDISATPGVFRVIKLLPPLESCLPFGSPTLRIEIWQATVKDSSTFNALSYTWGLCGSAPDRPVIVETADGPRWIHIFQPLETALLELSTAPHDTSWPIFVDQICINQLDRDEKSAQVQLMGHIYTKCKRVFIWIGPGNKSSNQYFDFTKEVCQEGVLARFLGQRSTAFIDIFDAVMDTDISVEGTDKEDRDDILSLLAVYGDRFPLDGIINVLQRTWFSRLWIIQEACLAPDLVFVCGSRSLCFDCFRSGMLFYTINNTHWTNTVTHTIPKDEVRRRNLVFNLNKNFIRIIQERRAIHTIGEKQKFSDLVLKYNVNNGKPKIGASLPEDRLFGLLGIATENDTCNDVRVRYGEVAEVYTEFAGILLTEKPDIISLSQHPKRVSTLPSWVPDWSGDLNTPRGYQDLTKPVFNAMGVSSPTQSHFNLAQKSIILPGVVCDKVLRVGERFMVKDEDLEFAESIDCPSAAQFFDEIDSFLEIASNMEGSPLNRVEEATRLQVKIRLSDCGLTEKYFTDTLGPEEVSKLLAVLHQKTDQWGKRLIRDYHYAEAYRMSRFLGLVDFKTLSHWAPPSELDVLAMCAKDPMLAVAEWSTALVSCCIDILGAVKTSILISAFRWFLRVRRRFSGIKFGARDEAFRAVGLDALSVSKDIIEYQANLLRNAGQTLYLTQKGYVGTGPASTKPGDSVAVFTGGTIPHILRQQGLNWTYIGETYCEGIMNGELVQQGEISGVNICMV
ncbi:heterokaryon incompatibility protein [Leptodontidium sp. MPI-SDFR-AT-0119]|nr:heterokaryon incompatibility protein [Leptodontidium sp. MPI-SDFR-AT-0119]